MLVRPTAVCKMLKNGQNTLRLAAPWVLFDLIVRTGFRTISAVSQLRPLLLLGAFVLENDHENNALDTCFSFFKLVHSLISGLHWANATFKKYTFDERVKVSVAEKALSHI